MEDVVNSNRHPVDELADVRAEIKILSTREFELRAELLADGADLSGGEHYARITTATQHRLDRKLLEAKFGKAAVEACCSESHVTTIRLVKRDLEDAA